MTWGCHGQCVDVPLKPYHSSMPVQADLKVFLEHSQQSFHKPSSTLALCWIGTSVVHIVHPDPTVYHCVPLPAFFPEIQTKGVS